MGTVRKWLDEVTLEAYNEWHVKAKEFGDLCDKFCEDHPNGEDLLDWVETVGRLLSFTPHVPSKEERENYVLRSE